MRWILALLTLASSSAAYAADPTDSAERRFWLGPRLGVAGGFGVIDRDPDDLSGDLLLGVSAALHVGYLLDATVSLRGTLRIQPVLGIISGLFASRADTITLLGSGLGVAFHTRDRRWEAAFAIDALGDAHGFFVGADLSGAHVWRVGRPVSLALGLELMHARELGDDRALTMLQLTFGVRFDLL